MSFFYRFKTLARLLGMGLRSGNKDGYAHDKRSSTNGLKIVAIGGGTGLSTMLRGLKLFTSNITAIVTVADDGGGSGVLRNDLGMLPPGDIRNCIMALANTEPIMEQLFQYRFKEGMLKGQSFGNLFLAAMNGISASFEEAVRKVSDVLAVKGRVLPVSLEDVRLCAQLADGRIICGESNIGNHNALGRPPIKRVFLEPKKVKPLDEALNAINEADAVVMGPGSLYTSIIPNLLVEGMAEALKNCGIPRLYVCNVMTQPGETENYSVYDHIKAIENHSFKGIVDYCIINSAPIPEKLLKKYRLDGAGEVVNDIAVCRNNNIKIIRGDFLSIKNDLVRHDPQKLASTIIRIVADNVLAKDKKRIIDYYYAKDRLKKLSKIHLPPES